MYKSFTAMLFMKNWLIGILNHSASLYQNNNEENRRQFGRFCKQVYVKNVKIIWWQLLFFTFIKLVYVGLAYTYFYVFLPKFW